MRGRFTVGSRWSPTANKDYAATQHQKANSGLSMPSIGIPKITPGATRCTGQHPPSNSGGVSHLKTKKSLSVMHKKTMKKTFVFTRQVVPMVISEIKKITLQFIYFLFGKASCQGFATTNCRAVCTQQTFEFV
jgi:hypothetical protein